MLVFHHQLVNLGRASESEKSQDREKRANSSIYILVGLATLREERVSPPGLTSQWRGLECYTCPAKALSQLLLLHPGAKPCRPTLLRRSMWPPSTTTQTLICPGWEILVVLVSQPGTPVQDKRRGVLLSRVWQPGQKGAPQFFFYFNYIFAFQLNLCIGIQCVWSPLIYTYIYSYLYNICPR